MHGNKASGIRGATIVGRFADDVPRGAEAYATRGKAAHAGRSRRRYRRTLAIMSKGRERDDDYPGEYFELKCMWDNHFNSGLAAREMMV